MNEATKKKISESLKGRLISEATKEKNRLGRLGKHHSEETKRKISIWQKGKKLSEETKKKMGDSHRGKHLSEEHKKKLSEIKKGHCPYKMTEEIKRKISKALKGKQPKFIPINKGRKMPISMGKKISERNKKMGIKPPSRKGTFKNDALTRQPGYYSFTEKNREIKKKNNGGLHTFAEWQTLKAQYNWTCPCCKRVEPKIKLTQDHIIPISKGGSNNIENIQPLCQKCNSKKHTKIVKYFL